MDFFPEIVQVVPHSDYSVSVYFHDGKIVRYSLADKLERGMFPELKNTQVFMETCTILNDTLAWDVAGNRDASRCIDIDPDVLYQLPAVEDQVA